MRSKTTPIQAIAKAFTSARSDFSCLSDYPDEMPQTSEEAYSIQDAAISLWPQKINGWKVGGIGPDLAIKYGARKLVGPIFANQIYKAGPRPTLIPVFEKGFAAVEGEIVLILNENAPTNKTNWCEDEAKAIIGAAHIGVEIASSPFRGINEHGPLVTISDFGNNYGLIIGEEIPNWQSFDTNDWIVETFIDGKSMGIKSSGEAGGPLESLAFCLNNTAQRGRPLKKGMAISTGAITGVHQAFVGQQSTVTCKGTEDIHLKLISGTAT